ncbi:MULTISPECIES: hypothetical protein [Streptomyces]|uniref:hypothetical protein n=1 Tax=Streptomyces TaxID=1883 RepID=UPI000CD4E6CD|nr:MULTISPECIES: hypothetical protein [Streptomyces]
MTSRVLSFRIDGALMDRLTQHAARRGMTLQEYVARTLVREDFDERFHDAVERTERLDGRGSTGRVGQDA